MDQYNEDLYNDLLKKYISYYLNYTKSFNVSFLQGIIYKYKKATCLERGFNLINKKDDKGWMGGTHYVEP